MSPTQPGQRSSDRYDALTTDLHPPLNRHEASVESDRCYFCYDAPCVTACPTGIDIPLFIRQIATDNAGGAAKTIFDENIFGGMCARVCPTETLCEQACVRTAAEEKPVRIGELQRYATDQLMSTGSQPFQRASDTGRRIAVVGAGPAGISCAHRLAMHGHHVTVFDSLPKSGGLNEYGIAAYKTVDDFAQRELQWILSIGGITVQHNTVLGVDIQLHALKQQYDAVFLGIGLGAVNALDMAGEDVDGVDDAVSFIARLRQTQHFDQIEVGQRVVVLGGGMTAIDAAVQARLLGAEDVTLAYRRGQSRMNASIFEQELAQKQGVLIKTWLQPLGIVTESGKITGVEFVRTQEVEGALQHTSEKLIIPCDQVLKAVGQAFVLEPGQAPLTLQKGRIAVDADRRSSDARIWAGGDCVADGDDLTVSAVQDGKLAAESIHHTLTSA